MLLCMRHEYHDEFRALGEALQGSRSAVSRSVQRARGLRSASDWERRRSGQTGILKRARYKESSLHLGQRVRKSWRLKINLSAPAAEARTEARRVWDRASSGLAGRRDRAMFNRSSAACYSHDRNRDTALAQDGLRGADPPVLRLLEKGHAGKVRVREVHPAQGAR